MQTTKWNTKHRQQLWFAFRVLLFLSILVLLYVQLKQRWDFKLETIHVSRFWALFLALVLLPLNYWLDFQKWKVIARAMNANNQDISKAYLSGISTAFLSPNGWGNFVGRWLYTERKNRLRVAVATSYSNLSQLLPTILFGCFAILGFVNWELWLMCSIFLLGIGVWTLYWLFPIISFSKWQQVKWLKCFNRERLFLKELRTPLVVWSLLRYVVFAAQYLLLFVAFGVTDVWLLLQAIPIIYLLTAFVPSLWSGKILIRETAAITVFHSTSVPVEIVILASLLIWVINIVLPTFISSFVLLIRKRKHK